jgi:phage shock protein PspC (stress-responsive transcriptional regulator)
MIAGVCSGLADYTGIDPIIFRLIFVALVFAGGTGLLLYGLAWIFVPEVGSSRAHGRDLLDRFETTPWLGAALLIVGGAILLGQIHVFSSAIRWGVALLILGALLFRERQSRQDRGPRPRPAVPATPGYPSPGYASPAPAPATAADAGTTAVLPPAAVAAPRPPRERSALGWYTVAVALMALGIAALLDASDAIHLTLVQYLAVPLAVIGAGLIVGAWLGRSRLLIFLGILLVPFVLVASVIHVPLTGGTGTFTYRPQRAGDIPAAYHIAAGELTLDLSRLALASGTTNVTATVGAGQLRVLVPLRVPLTIDGRAGMGTVNVFGRNHDGTEVHVQKSAQASSRPGLTLHLQTGLGLVQVDRISGNGSAFPVPVQPTFP